MRALVHKADTRSERLRNLGTEIAEGDLLDFASVRAALEGVGRAYSVFPIVPGIIQATAYFAQAATEVGFEAIVTCRRSRHDGTRRVTPLATTGLPSEFLTAQALR